nr:hypothetical protein A132_13095 [Vibrio kanaloae 5S-149]
MIFSGRLFSEFTGHFDKKLKILRLISRVISDEKLGGINYLLGTEHKICWMKKASDGSLA